MPAKRTASSLPPIASIMLLSFSAVLIMTSDFLSVNRRREEKREDLHQAPKSIYKKADEGWPVPGVNVPYEEPARPEITIDTERTDINKAVKIILESLKQSK